MTVAPEFWKKTTILLGTLLLASQIFEIKISLKPETALLLGIKPAASYIVTSPRPSVSSVANQSAPSISSSPTTVSLVATTSSALSNLSLNQEGYNQLLKWEKEIQLSENELPQFAGFDVSMPCCGFQKTVSNYQDNCECGHHLATYGLIKKMLKEKFSRLQIQTEVSRWTNYFYPNKGGGGSAGSC